MHTSLIDYTGSKDSRPSTKGKDSRPSTKGIKRSSKL